MHIILPMAGKGTRVKDFSSNNKPFIKLNGVPLLQLSMLGLPLKSNKLVLVANKSDYAELLTTLAGIKWLDLENVKIELIDAVTAGQAETALIGMRSLDPSESVLITSCDTYFTNDFPVKVTADGLLGTFESNSPKYSYVRLEGGIAVETAEKIVISNRASAGLYYFSSVELYRRAYSETEFIGEKYIAPMYNYLIKEGLKVEEFPIDRVIPLGTTEELVAASISKDLLDKIEDEEDSGNLPKRFRDIANGE